MKDSDKSRILVIDDSEANIAALTRILSPYYSVISAKNGPDGIELAKTKIPDVIILDIIMPEMDGYAVIAILKKSIQTRKIPVVFISGLANAVDEEKGLALGGADYISKPFSDEVVKLRVNNQIRILNYVSTIERLSRTDQLTGLPNRRSFDEKLFSEWKRSRREGKVLSILIIDIDFFKRCNDTFGHLRGDVVIQRIAEIIQKALTRPADFAARWGGEEFIVLLPMTDATGTTFIAEEIRKSVEAATITFKGGRTTKVTVSIGSCSEIPTDEFSVDDFLHNADLALYTAKNEGRNKVRQYVEGLR